MMHIRKKTEKGFALLLAIIISSVMLAIGVSILKISVNQITLSATARESEFAFQAAHAGIDCMSYWREEQTSIYTSTSSAVAVPAPATPCFGVSSIPAPTKDLVDLTEGTFTTFTSIFSWGTPARCTQTEMYVMNAYSGNMQVNFTTISDVVGVNGLKSCDIGTVCTVLISRGYNRACAAIGPSVYTVQRELTAEF